MAELQNLVRFFDEIGRDDVDVAGGKGANLGEMYTSGLPVPEGFVVTSEAYKRFTRSNGLATKIERALSKIDVDDVADLERGTRAIRELIESSPVPADLEGEISNAYRRLCWACGNDMASVAVRSSATSEDSSEASFAGQQATYLNVRGTDAVSDAVRRCWASVFTARATFYRAKKGLGDKQFGMAVVVQRQVASETAGVGFSIHPTTGDTNTIVIEGSYGQGESTVSGRTTPDSFLLAKSDGKVIERRIADKKTMMIPRSDGVGLVEAGVPRRLRGEPCLSDDELSKLWDLGKRLELHYGAPQDFEWAVEDGKIYLLQTRPVTVAGSAGESTRVPKTAPLVSGLGASPGMGSGKVRIISKTKDLIKLEQGDVLVTKMTSPDFVPAMMKTSAIVTDEGGMTSHAAIVSRELGVPCVVGTRRGTSALTAGEMVSVDGSMGNVYRGRVEAEAAKGGSDADAEAPPTLTKIYMNLGVPEKIKAYANIPFDGIGLMRVEFIIASAVGAHPLYLLEKGKGDIFVERLAKGMEEVARAVHPRPVVVRFSDFKTNEYRDLRGGRKFEAKEENPMIGWRGVSRYVSPEFRDAFRLELRAMKTARERGLENIWAMLPFVRTTNEVEQCTAMMKSEGLARSPSFKVWLMAEVPSVVFLAPEFARRCDGFSIGSNDLTQLILGIDRDSTRLGRMGYFDERNEAVKRAMRRLIEGAHREGRTVSICGQGPSVYPELAEFLVESGIDSMSVNPDTVGKTRAIVARIEKRLGRSPSPELVVTSGNPAEPTKTLSEA